MVENHPEYFAAVTYHTWWPSAADPYYAYDTLEVQNRVNYYPPHTDGYYYTPYAWIDGTVRGGRTYDLWGGMMLARRKKHVERARDLRTFDERARYPLAAFDQALQAVA